MKSLRITLFALLLPVVSLVAKDVPPRVYELAKQELPSLAADPIVIEAVASQNAQHKTLDEIKAFDTKWQETHGVADFMKELMSSPTGQHLKEWRKTHEYVVEIILMDNQGANVALTNKTSDYWQGDEAKFIECYKDGGVTYVDKVKFDESSQAYSVQVSVPVKQGDTLIGAICFTIDTEQL